MSTNHTTNYDLNQWEGTDKVLRAEFNVDNAKIDAALKANADAIAAEAAAREAAVTELTNRSRFTKLKELNITSHVTSAELDLSDVDWNQWDKVHVDICSTNGQQGSMYLNDTSSENYLGSFGGSLSLPGVFHPRLTLYPAFQPGRCITVSMSGPATFFAAAYSTVKKVIFSGNMTSGIYLALWGEK